jgi:hypothetical protein
MALVFNTLTSDGHRSIRASHAILSSTLKLPLVVVQTTSVRTETDSKNSRHSNIRYIRIMASSIRSFRVEAAFSGTCKTNVTEKVTGTRLEINLESGRPLQAGARVGSALYRSLKSVATSKCRAPLVYYILLVETTRNSNGKMFAYQVNIDF